MKAVLYKRVAYSDYHMHASPSAHCVFVPERDVVLYKERHGTFGGETYSITREDRMVTEAKLVAIGKPVNKIRITDVRTFELKEEDVQALIEIADRHSSLDSEIRTKIDAILGVVAEDLD